MSPKRNGDLALTSRGVFLHPTEIAFDFPGATEDQDTVFPGFYFVFLLDVNA